MELNELKLAMQEALASGDDTKFWELHKAVGKLKTEAIQAVVKQQQDEALALTGDRDKLAVAIKKAVSKLGFDDQIRELKAKGFSYTVDRTEYPPGEPEVYVTGGCSLIVPAVKARVTGTGATGIKGSLQTDYERFKDDYAKATGEDIDTQMAEAVEKDKTVSNQGYSYNVKKKVRKWAIAKQLLVPVK